MRDPQIWLIALASCLVICQAMPNPDPEPEPEPDVNVNLKIDVNQPDESQGNVNVDVNVNIDDDSNNTDGNSGDPSELKYRPYCESCGIEGSKNRIVGGTEARQGRWPWQAFLVFLTVDDLPPLQCGGSIIKKGWILTAAHCFTGTDISQMIVSLGDHNVKNLTEAESQTFLYSTFDIEDYVFLHPNYDDNTVNNDIALIELKEDLVFNKIIQPVCLGLSEDIITNKTVVATGWGQTGDREDISDVLLEVSLDVIDWDQCVDLYQKTPFKSTITVNMICTLTPGKDACGGDSGGPLVSQLEDGRWVQIGIVSFGFQCAFHQAPGVYTKVANYFDWIEETTRSNNCSSVLPDYDYDYDYNY